MTETATEWSLRTWKQRHEDGYFPKSQEHSLWRIYEQVPDWLATECNAETQALEIGCGYGQWLQPLSRLVKLACGFDIHSDVINKGVRLLDAHDVRNVILWLNDGTSIPAGSDVADLVYSISVFQHLPRAIVTGYLDESFRVLKPGGVALHHFRNMDNVGPFPQPAADIVANHTGDFSAGWTKQECLDAFRAAKFSGCTVNDLGLHLVCRGVKR